MEKYFGDMPSVKIVGLMDDPMIILVLPRGITTEMIAVLIQAQNICGKNSSVREQTHGRHDLFNYGDWLGSLWVATASLYILLPRQYQSSDGERRQMYDMEV